MDIKRIVLESNNEEETDYFVSSDGRIFKEITPSKNGNGYAMVTIYKNGIGYTKSVHRIVAKAFLQKVKGKEYINHINGDKMDNRMVYTTRKYRTLSQDAEKWQTNVQSKSMFADYRW